MPTSCAPTGDCISARTPLPSSVQRSSAISATLEHQRQAEHQQLVAGEARRRRSPPARQVVVAAQVAAPHQRARSSAPGTSGRSRPSGRAPRTTSTFGALAASRAEAQPVHAPGRAPSAPANDTGSISSGDRPERGVRHPGEVGAQHQELAVRDVQDAHQAVLQVQAERDQRIDAARDQAAGRRSARSPCAVQRTRLTSRPAWRRSACAVARSRRPHHLELAVLPLAHGAGGARRSRCPRSVIVAEDGLELVPAM